MTGAAQTRLAGHLELVCGVDSRGLSAVRHQSFRAPVHLIKPYLDAGVLVLNVVKPTAGLLAGDRLRVDVTVEPGASLLLTTPAATRVHAMPAGWAQTEQRFRVGAGARLEYWPELLILQGGARYRQQTTIDLAAGGELLYFETVAPGRVASGEIFAYEELRWETDLRFAGRLMARERYLIRPLEGALDALRRRFPTAYCASGLLVARELTAASVFWAQLRAWQNDDLWVGTSALSAPDAFSLKLIAADSITLRRAMQAVRAAVHHALGRSAPSLRRAGAEFDCPCRPCKAAPTSPSPGCAASV